MVVRASDYDARIFFKLDFMLRKMVHSSMKTMVGKSTGKVGVDLDKSWRSDEVRDKSSITSVPFLIFMCESMDDA